MDEQRQLLDEMLAQAESCVKELQPQLVALTCGSTVDLATVEKTIVTAVLRLGAAWLGLLLNLYAARLAQAIGTRRPCGCGGRMRWVSQRTKTMLSLLGKVRYARVYFHCAQCQQGEALGDRAWGLEHTRTTAGVVQLVAYLSAGHYFAETARQVCRTLCWPREWLSGKQVQRLAEPIGRRLGALESAQVAQWWQQVTAVRAQMPGTGRPGPVRRDDGEQIERLYVQMDGTMARLRGLVGKGSDYWREVKVGAVFVAERGPRVSRLARAGVATAVGAGQAIRSWVDRPRGAITYVSGLLPAAAFGGRLYAEAVRRGLERAEEVVILGDGAHWIWELAQEHFPGAVQILDFWHASEWVWKVAHAAWGVGSVRAKEWAEKQIEEHLITGDAAGLIEAIGMLPPVPPPPGAARSIPEQAQEYFQNNAARMRYPEYRARGMEIGSGAIESAAKRVVGLRCKGPGMRWSEEGLPAVLELRTHVLNERFDDAFAALPKVS